MAPEDLPFIERLFRGEEMPFDIGGPVKLSAKAARRTALLQLLKSGRFGALLDRAGVSVPTDRLRGVLRGNPTNPSKVDDLASQISREGQRDALSISVDKAGRPFIGEGNHRLDAIRQLGLPEAKISITPNVADDAQQFSAFLKALGL